MSVKGADRAASSSAHYKVGDLRIDTGRKCVLRRGSELAITGLSFDLLLALARSAPDVVSVDEIMQEVWPGLVVGPETVSQRVKLLRQALGDDAERPCYIASVRGRGYRLVPTVTAVTASKRPALENSASRNTSPSLPGPSLAVLPFINLGKDPDQEYFVEGMMDEIVTALTRVRSLFVIASSATLSLKGQALDPQTVARRLGVRYILEGSVRRAGSRVRIAVKLTDARGAAQVWAERFEGTLEDVFALQDYVALGVAGIIEPNIQAAELRRSARTPVENLGSYDLYLRAARLRATLRKPEVMQALELLNRAIALEPHFAPALAQAAGCHSQIYFNGWADDREAHRREGLAMAERAVNAGGDDASVLAQVANAVVDLDNNFDWASDLIERATALNPGSAHAWFLSGLQHITDGQYDTAIERFQRTARLDPISQLNEAARAHIGICKALLGEFEEAVRLLRATAYRSPRAQLTVVVAYGQLGQWSQAREELRLYEQLTTIQAETMVSGMRARKELKTLALETIARARES